MQASSSARPAVTVIALCYNHARFLLDCLDSIAAQTCRDFELIVTDDCSRDGSADLIAAWIAERHPQARFIRHEHNRGICATLNEALGHARGEFISMVATDDMWEPHKIATQLAAMRQAAADVAVVYSDASQMDEQGVRLPQDFMAAHRPGPAPTGDIFPALADGNFIPAMATLIRTSAIAAVGGYDERLTYEDYDMWLRLAARFRFLFVPEVVARYRIVATSMVRTTFVAPTANHCYTQFLIRERFIGTGKLTASQQVRWTAIQADAAYGLYVHGDARANACLWTSARRTARLRLFVLAATSSLGLTRARGKRLVQLLGRRDD